MPPEETDGLYCPSQRHRGSFFTSRVLLPRDIFVTAASVKSNVSPPLSSRDGQCRTGMACSTTRSSSRSHRNECRVAAASSEAAAGSFPSLRKRCAWAIGEVFVRHQCRCFNKKLIVSGWSHEYSGGRNAPLISLCRLGKVTETVGRKQPGILIRVYLSGWILRLCAVF